MPRPLGDPVHRQGRRVFACCFAASANERQLGQLGSQTFEEVWTGSAFQEFRRDIIDGGSTPSICRRCTIAPLGKHLFQTWGATIVSGHIAKIRAATATVSISVRNDGEQPWTRVDQVHIGTAAPRDSNSPLQHPAWLSHNRAATFLESTVPPGAIATFRFPVAAPRGVTTDEFEIVADPKCWIPNTRFSLTIRRRELALLKLLRHGFRRGLHAVIRASDKGRGASSGTECTSAARSARLQP